MKKTNYSQTMADHLRSLRQDLDTLKVKAGEDVFMKDEMHDVIDELEEKFTVLEERLHDLEIARRENWMQVRSSVDRAWEEASYAFDRARDRYFH